MTIIERIQRPTPHLFRQLRTWGLVTASIGGVLLSSPVTLPILFSSLGGYLVVAGGVLTAVSQLTVDDLADDTSVTTG